jgi:hypothetical protein
MRRPTLVVPLLGCGAMGRGLEFITKAISTLSNHRAVFSNGYQTVELDTVVDLEP